MATITKTDLIVSVLGALQVIAATDTPTAEDTVTVGDWIDAEFDKLLELSLIDYTTSGIPISAKGPLTKYLAHGLMGTYPVTEANRTQLNNDVDTARREIAALRANTKVGEPAPATYF